MHAGGLIYHFFHEPIPLEITMDYLVFTFVDDSEEKLSIETFMVIFVFLSVGYVIGLLALLAEIWAFRRQAKVRRIDGRIIIVKSAKPIKKRTESIV